MGGRYLMDGTFETTGALQADRYYETIAISTPTTPPTNHGRLYLDFNRRFCAKFDNGNALCFSATSATSTFTSITAIDPLAYDYTTGNLTIDQIGLSTGVVGILADSHITNTFTSSKTFSGVDLFMDNGVINASGTVAIRAQKSLALYDKDNINNVTIQAAATTASYNMQVPTAQGASNSLLQNDGTGALTWASSNSIRGYISATDPVVYTPATGVISLSQVSLSTGVTGILSISTQTNLTASGSAVRNASNISVGPIKIGTGTLGAFDVSTTSASATGSAGIYSIYNISGGSITARNIASGTQCVQADGSGNLTGTGSGCGSGSGDMILASTQTVTGGKVFTSYVNFRGTTTIKGLTNGGSAAAGDIGETLSATAGATTISDVTLTDIATIALSSGTYLIFGSLYFHDSGAACTQAIGVISTTAGNDFTGSTQGQNRMDSTPPTTTIDTGVTIITATTVSGSGAAQTWRIKAYLACAGGTRTAGGQIYAIRYL